MSVTIVPTSDASGAAKKQAEINAALALPASHPAAVQAAERAEREQRELVQTLLGQGKLNAATILANLGTPTVRGSSAASNITALNAAIASNSGNTLLVLGLQRNLAEQQAQLVLDAMAAGLHAYTASNILATQSYIGPAPGGYQNSPGG